MKRRIFSLFLVVIAALCAPLGLHAQSRYDYMEFLVRWEGFKTKLYKDGRNWSTGIGHSLSAHGQAPKKSYTQAEIIQFFDTDLAAALVAARNGVDRFDELPADVKKVVIGVVWTCGPTGFMKFTDFRFALGHRMYTSSQAALKQSKWATQVSPLRLQNSLDILDRY